MTNIYYTARTGKRNANGHTTTRGDVYAVLHGADALDHLGSYTHQSGGAGIERSLLDVVEKAGIDTGGGYFKSWREAVNLIEI